MRWCYRLTGTIDAPQDSEEYRQRVEALRAELRDRLKVDPGPETAFEVLRRHLGNPDGQATLLFDPPTADASE